MKALLINKSDGTGGAAVVSRRLMDALRREGVDARMLVCEKLTDSPYVEVAAKPSVIKKSFLLERLKIFISNGFNRKSLFKIDTGEEGLPLWKHPLVKNADAILLNWVNQGMLSLEGIRKILELGKPVIWTMHDMWCMTGICHHAGTCERFHEKCGECPLLGSKASPEDLSHKIWEKKEEIYSDSNLTRRLIFVPVSNWLKRKGLDSSLLQRQKMEVIPNAFDLKEIPLKEIREKEKIRILFGAARLDDPIKGLDTLKETAKILKRDNPEISSRLEIAMFGNVKNPESLEGFELPLKRLGVLRGEETVAHAYLDADILVSASSYETLPGTLVEAQAYGCIPVSFNQGGQSDIIEGEREGILIEYACDLKERAYNLAEGIKKAVEIMSDREKYLESLQEMHENVKKKFSYSKVAREYISLIQKLSKL